MIFARLERAGFRYARSCIECVGGGAIVPLPALRAEAGQHEVMLRVSVHDVDRQAVERFAKEFAPLVTSGPPGVTGYTTGRPQVREVFAYWPALVAKSAVTPCVTLVE